MKILEVIIKQLLFIYIGGGILFLIYKIQGKGITYNQIINEDNKYGMKKHRYLAFYIGVIFLIAVVLIIDYFVS